MSDEEKKKRSERVKALREFFGFKTQQALAYADPLEELQREEVVKVETGSNACTGSTLQKKFARAFRLDLADFIAVVEGRISVEEAKRRRQRDPVAGPLVKALDKHESLRRVIIDHPDRWRVSTIVRAISGDTYVREGEHEPEVGWVRYLNAIQNGKADEVTGDAHAVTDAARKQAGPRSQVPGFRPRSK